MNTIEICSRNSNMGMSEREYRVHDKYRDYLFEAWQLWTDEVTREFWEGDKNPELPTKSFEEDFFNNFEFDEIEHLIN